MTGSRNRFDDDSELDQLAQDLDLDMDAPIGATFAAALRQRDGDVAAVDAEFTVDDDGFMTPPSKRAPGASPLHSALFADPVSSKAEIAYASDDFAEDAENFEVEYPSAQAALSRPVEHKRAIWLEPESRPAPPVEDLPPIQDEPALTAEEEAAGQGLGYDYAFAASSEGGDRAIPRITVHAFCNRSDSLGLMRTIMKDRRMKNVSMEARDGGVAGAIQHYVNETTPNLLIIEGAGDPRQLLSELDALAGYCDENIKVVILGHTNDIRLYRELMRRGVSEYLVAPFDPVQMIRSIATLFTDPEAPFTGKTLAVTGVKGGVGASSIAHNLAWALSERLKVNSTLIDLDLNFGTTGLDFNQDTQATIADALMSPDRFDDAVMGRLITKATDRLSLFTAPATLDRTYNLEPETYNRVLDQVRGSVPFVVLDLPHIWSDWFKSTIIGADEIVVVAAPDLASLRNGKNLIDFLKAARPNDSQPRLVLNMVGLPKRPEIPAADFAKAVGIAPTFIIPHDPQTFGTAQSNGQMIFEVAPKSKTAEMLTSFAQIIAGNETAGKAVKSGRTSLFQKLPLLRKK
jgi:pilus assembly protein CpaE